jgi:predicted nucleic acid-binding protein
LQFTEQLSAANSQVVFSELTRLEFANAVAEVARSSRRRLELPGDMVKEYGLDRWSSDPGIRSHWLKFGHEELEALLNSFYAVVEVPIDDLVLANAVDMMADHDLRSYDALHIATARLQSIRHVASCDGAFINAAPLTELVLVRDSGITIGT